MVAAGDGVGAGLDELVVDRFGNTEAAGGIFAVDHDEIELPVANKGGHALGNHGASAATDDVADEENAHQQTLSEQDTATNVKEPMFPPPSRGRAREGGKNMYCIRTTRLQINRKLACD
jgi:hypothetical protein